MKASHILGLAIVACAAIYSVNVGDFFFHDSVATLENNPGIMIPGDALDGWRTAAMSTSTGSLGRPVSMLSFAANHVLGGGLSAAHIKLTNILVHLLCGGFLWLFLALVLERSPLLGLERRQAQLIGAVAAAIWLLHPLQVSTVMYAVQRMTQLAALFTFAGLWHVFLLRSRWLEKAPAAADYSRLLLVGLLWTALATLSKENGLLLPLLAAVTELTLFRFRVAGRESIVIRTAVIGALASTLLLLVGLPLAMGEFFDDWYAMRPFDLGERVLTQARLLWHYLGWIALPDITAMGFNHDDIPLSRGLFAPLSTVVAILALVGVAGVSWRLRNRWPLPGFAVAWFLCGHVLESTIIPLELAYEHRNYLPSAGPILFLSALPFVVRGERAGVARACLLLVVFLLLPLLYLRATAWESEIRLTETQVRYHPASPKSAFNLASAYYDEALAQADKQLAQRYFSASRLAAARALEREPDYLPALAWLILIDGRSSDTSRLAEWWARLRSSLDKPVLSHGDMRSIIAINQCITRQGCPEPAGGQESFLRALLAKHPGQLHLRMQLANYCLSAGRRDCAREEAELVLARRPGFAAALELLYRIEIDAGRPGRALEIARRLMKADRDRRLVASLLGDSGA